MKRFFKTIRNKTGKVLLWWVVRSKKFELLPRFVRYFPKERYKASFQLLKTGYLDLAHEVIREYTPKENERHLKQRIESMIEIKNKGLNLEKNTKKPIKNISVLFAVHNSFPYDHAGYAIRTEHIASNLQKRGIDLLVASRPGYPWDLQKHRKLKERKRGESFHGVEYIRLEDKDKSFKKGSDLDYIDVYAGELMKAAKQNATTILHAHSNYLNGIAAAKAANELKIPCVYEVRGLWHITRTTLDPDFKDGGMYAYEETMERAAIEAADAVVTISQALKDLIVSWGKESKKIHVAHNAVDADRFQPRSRSQRLVEKYSLNGKTVVGFIGSLTGYEGLQELVLATNELIAEGMDIALIIVGEGRERAKLESLVKSKDIIFTGRVPYEEVEEYYTLFDICPFPRNDFEVCRYVPPLKILEAMAMEKAVIVSDVAPLLEIIENGKNGLVCKADSIKSLKESIKKLYLNDALRNKLGKQARQWVKENRSWEKTSETYIKLYKSFEKDGNDK